MEKSSPPRSEVVKAIVCYSITSASLLLINKLLMYHVPLPSFVSLFEFVFCFLIVLVMDLFNVIQLDYICWEKLKLFSLYVFSFSIGIYSNLRTLQLANVETIIVFRACCPICVSILDYLFLGREYPSRTSIFALLIIVFGAYGFLQSENHVNVELNGFSSYYWALLYTISLCFQMSYGKMIVEKSSMKSTWEQVYYTKLLSCVPMLCFGILSGEVNEVVQIHIKQPRRACLFLFLSCLGGVIIGFSGWRCRQLISAASYTLVGVTNKILTIFLNLLIWDVQNVTGILFLLVCILGSALYEQAPYRSEAKISDSDETEILKKQDI